MSKATKSPELDKPAFDRLPLNAMHFLQTF